jgi:DNA mismatch repair protein MLH1
VKLFLVDYGMVSNEYFYQVGLTHFGNFGAIRFEPPLNLKEVLVIAAENEKATANTGADEFDPDEVAQLVSTQLIERREMLLGYFSLEISEDGDLISWVKTLGARDNIETLGSD